MSIKQDLARLHEIRPSGLDDATLRLALRDIADKEHQHYRQQREAEGQDSDDDG